MTPTEYLNTIGSHERRLQTPIEFVRERYLKLG